MVVIDVNFYSCPVAVPANRVLNGGKDYNPLLKLQSIVLHCCILSDSVVLNNFEKAQHVDLLASVTLVNTVYS